LLGYGVRVKLAIVDKFAAVIVEGKTPEVGRIYLSFPGAEAVVSFEFVESAGEAPIFPFGEAVVVEGINSTFLPSKRGGA
jgi:hypothetical protein